MMVEFAIVMHLRMMIMLLLLMMLCGLMMLECVETVRAKRSFENFAPIFLRKSIVVCVIIIAADCRGNHFWQWRHWNFVITFNAHRTPMLLFIPFASTSSKALCEKLMRMSL